MSCFVYFNTESNKFNFIKSDGQLQITNGQPLIKTNHAEMIYIPQTDTFSSHTMSLNSDNRYIAHINFNAINNDICFIDDISLDEALNKYSLQVVDSSNNILAKYILADSTNPIIHFNATLFVENTDSLTIQTNYSNIRIYEQGCSILLETL